MLDVRMIQPFAWSTVAAVVFTRLQPAGGYIVCTYTVFV